MPIWSAEIKEVKHLLDSFQGQFSDLEKELKPLITSEDPNVVLLYSRRCLEVIINELCEVELKRPRKTEPLKGIIDKLNSESKVPSHIITSMHSLNSLATYGTHPKDFEVEQVKPVLNNLFVIIKWYLKYKESQSKDPAVVTTQKEVVKITLPEEKIRNKTKKVLIYSLSLIIVLAVVFVTVKTNFLKKEIEKSIAVLPFRNDSPEDSTQYFMDGVMEELLNKLQSVKSLRVLGRTSVEQFRGLDKSISEIAKELGVNYIVEGSGQKSGNSLRMRVQLLVARNESHLWGNSFEQENLDMGDYFKAQSGFAGAIANELNAVMTAEEKKLIGKIQTINLETYDNYLKGHHHLGDGSKESLQKAMEYLNRAIMKDPDWAPLYSGLAQVWMTIQQGGYEPPSVASPKIYENLNKALELDPNLSEAHYLRAMIAHLVEWDWEKSEREFLKALAVNPNDASSRVLYAQLLCILQRTDEGIIQGRLALDLDPLNPLIKCLYGAILPCAGDCKTALALAEEVTSADPGHYLANVDILFAALRCKEYNKVIKAERYLLPFFNIKEEDLKEFERIFYEQGIAKAYEKIMKHLEEFAENNPISFSDMAPRYILANQPDKALDWIEKGFEQHDPVMTYIATKIFNLDPLFNSLRFIDIVKKMNLPLPKN